jgi:hypothetical protein
MVAVALNLASCTTWDHAVSFPLAFVAQNVVQVSGTSMDCLQNPVVVRPSSSRMIDFRSGYTPLREAAHLRTVWSCWVVGCLKLDS